MPDRSGLPVRDGADLLMRQVAVEVGGTIEQGLALGMDRTQDAVLLALERAAIRGMNTRAQFLARQMNRPLRTWSFLLPPTAGRVASATSYLAMKTGFALLVETRLALTRCRMRGTVPRRGM
ncbi:MAG TPA: hypothetical protein VIM33_15320 [Gaiellaceae bacterium]|jgi:hypothetical protein